MVLADLKETSYVRSLDREEAWLKNYDETMDEFEIALSFVVSDFNQNVNARGATR